MTNPFYTATGAPVQESRGTSPAVRNEFSLLQTAMDGVFAAIDIGAASGTSTTSLLVGTGSKSFTIQAGRAFSPGQSVVLAYNVTPTTQMTGTITSYNSTTGAVVMNVTGTNGSGTYADWTLSLNPSDGATLGANVFTGVQDWATGASIASAATINLNTATGNRVHITGTTTITAVTLTRGPRTLIFDGALTLTHNATTNNLPGGANIITAAGDRAVYESDGTTVYCIAYIPASNDHSVTVTTGNGHGSTNNKIRRFTTTQSSTGTAITYADSAANGASFTINQAGMYEIYYCDDYSVGGSTHGISVNSAQLTTSITSITAANRLGYALSTAGGNPAPVTRVVRLAAGDVIRPHTDGTPDTTSVLTNVFSIRRIGPA